jgi:hypothetical protein
MCMCLVWILSQYPMPFQFAHGWMVWPGLAWLGDGYSVGVRLKHAAPTGLLVCMLDQDMISLGLSGVVVSKT